MVAHVSQQVHKTDTYLRNLVLGERQVSLLLLLLT